MSGDLCVKDRNGAALKADDRGQVIRDLKVKGADMLKRGTVFKAISRISGKNEKIEAGGGRNAVVVPTIVLKKMM